MRSQLEGRQDFWPLILELACSDFLCTLIIGGNFKEDLESLGVHRSCVEKE